MNRIEHSPKTPGSKTGTFAQPGARPAGRGTGAPFGRRGRALGLVPVVAALALLLASVAFSAAASADTRIGGGFGTAAGQLSQANGLAVSRAEGGDLYVVDAGQNQRVDQFKPDGQFVRAFGWGVVNGAAELQTCTTVCQPNLDQNQEPVVGSEPGQLDYAFEIAIDNDPSSSSYGDVYVVDQRNFRVEKYSREGQFLLMFGGEVDKTTGADVCTAEDIEVKHDTCAGGVPGTGAGHFYQEGPSTTWDVHLPSWGTEGSNSIAVGPDGRVYVGDYGRVQEFEPDGVFAGELKLPDVEPKFVSALAVDSEGNIFERSVNYGGGGVIASQVPGVREYSPSHSLLRTFDSGPEETGSEPVHLALDEAGDLFVSDFNSGQLRFRAFTPTGALYAEFTSDQAQIKFYGVPGELHGIAVGDAAGALYATDDPASSFDHSGPRIAAHLLPEPGPPVVTEERVTEIEPTTATFRATVNPEQFETKYRFEYTTTDFSNCGEPANPSCHLTSSHALVPVSREDLVQEPISALTPATAYHWRIVAESTRNGGEIVAGDTETFETLPNVSVRDFTTQTVGPELVVLKAEIDPNNGGTTHYTICYGTEAGPAEVGHHAQGCIESTLNEVGNEFKPITAILHGLRPNTTYHYQLTASNSNGPVETGDAQFTTEETIVEEDARAGCANVLLREENDSLALPDCRAYEQVSPIFKSGSGVSQGGLLLSPSGDRAAFRSLGIFAGATASQVVNPYSVNRTPAGWLTQSPFQTPEAGFTDSSVTEYSAELDRWLVLVNQGATAQEMQEGTGIQEAYYAGDALTGSFTRFSPILAPPSGARQFVGDPVIAQSADLSRLFISAGRRLLPAAQDPLPDSPLDVSTSRIYEVAGAGGPAPSVRLLAEVPSGIAFGSEAATCELGRFVNHNNAFNPSSADGSTLFYTAPLELIPGGGCDSADRVGLPNKAAVFARTGAAPAIELSAESPTQCSSGHPCAGAPIRDATFDGASPDGRLAWFTTTQPLIDSDTDATGDLYVAELENGELKELVQASAGQATPTHPTPGQGAGVEGVLEVSPDGTNAAFVATGVLSAQPNSAGATAAAGADNLYVYDAGAGRTKFVASLCSGPEESGTVADPACAASLEANLPHSDRGLWESGSTAPEVQFTPDGADLLFSSWGRLTADDTDATRDVYRYDVATGGLIRVSFGHRGNDADGNDGAYPVSINSYALGGATGLLDRGAGDAARSLTADGSLAIFTTAAPLVSRDTNDVPDLYEWEESGHGACQEAGGCISLLSDGVDPHGTEAGVISSSGRDIAFTTGAGLVPADTDGLGDLYDAREGGGFPPPPVPGICHGAEICHASGTGETLPINPASESFRSPGSGAGEVQCARGKHKVKKHGQVRCVARKHHKKSAHHKKKHHKSKNHHQRASANRGGGK